MKLTFVQPFTNKKAASQHLGGRKSQQDAFLCLPDAFGPNIHLFAVMDGHGTNGGAVAEFVRDQLQTSVSGISGVPSKEALASLFNDLHVLVRENPALDAYMSGTTLTLLIVTQIEVIVANVGDSAAYLLTMQDETLVPTQLTMDSVEKERIISSGGRVEPAENDPGTCTTTHFKDVLRIYKGTLPYPGIVVTRAIGDTVATKLGVLSEPYISSFPLTSAASYILIASDGVWDGIEISKVVSVLCTKEAKEVQALSNRITNASLKGMNKKHLDDNTSNILIRLSWDE